MTRLRKRGTRKRGRPSLADFIKARSIEAARTAMAGAWPTAGTSRPG